MSTTLLALEKKLNEAIGDDLEFTLSTNLTTAATVIAIASTLNNHDEGQDDYFNEWWFSITDKANAGVQRKVSDYASTAYKLSLRGGAFAADTSAAACRLSRYNRKDKLWALQRALEELYPSIYEPIDDMSLVTGNILPSGHFEWNPTTASIKFLTGTSVTLSPTTSTGNYRGPMGTQSIKITATTDSCYAEYDSNTYPRLLDLQGRSVDFYCWVKPSAVDEAWIQIQTLTAAGTSQTLPSTWASTDVYANYWNQLSLEGQALSTDLQRVRIRFRVDQSSGYAYFDDAIVCGKYLHDYMLPLDFQTSGNRAHLSQVYVQTKGYSDPICYDIQPIYWDRQEFRIEDMDGYKWLHLKDLNTNYRRIRLIGYKPLKFSSTADSGTINLEGERLNLVIARAAQLLYRRIGQPLSSDDVSRYKENVAEWEREERTIKPSLMMTPPSDTLWTGR